ncbi:MAG: hypothetical protein ACHREM_32005, partial [Polyangiales bacterium]
TEEGEIVVHVFEGSTQVAAPAAAKAPAVTPAAKPAPIAAKKPVVFEIDEPIAESRPSGSLPSYSLDDEPIVAESAAPPPESIERSSEAGAGGAEVEEALDEADFYAAQGVFETARETIEEALKLSPRNPLLLEKLRDIEAAATALASSAEAAASSQAGDRAFDIAASLDALDALDDQPAEGNRLTSGGDQIDVEEVFAKFKEGVAAQVDAGDTQTHYDLGIAYEQMMLFDDAIQEFRVASKDKMREALCHSMIGLIYVKKGALAEATEAYKAGLHSEKLTRDEELALLYELGIVWESRKNKREAAYYLKRIMAADPTYRDAKGKLAALGPEATGDKGSGARPVTGIDEGIDAAFDDVIGKRK